MGERNHVAVAYECASSIPLASIGFVFVVPDLLRRFDRTRARCGDDDGESLPLFAESTRLVEKRRWRMNSLKIDEIHGWNSGLISASVVRWRILAVLRVAIHGAMELRRWKAESKMWIHRLRYSPNSVGGSWMRFFLSLLSHRMAHFILFRIKSQERSRFGSCIWRFKEFQIRSDWR